MRHALILILFIFSATGPTEPSLRLFTVVAHISTRRLVHLNHCCAMMLGHQGNRFIIKKHIIPH